jgi:transmembrane sensor
VSERTPHTPVNDEAIEAMAASWLVQRDEGFSAEQAAEFARWQKADPRHAAAVAMLEETCGILERMPFVREKFAPPEVTAPAPQPRGRFAPVVSFPRSLKFAAAIAACFVVALVAWKFRAAHDAVTFANSYATESGEYQRVVLPDQSVVELNANTELRVQFSERRRDVSLSRGEAHFTVAKNPARPFLVSAGHVTVRAVGTAFNVRHAVRAVDVLVTEGRVEVSNLATTTAATAGAQTPMLLGAGQRALVANDAAGGVAPMITSVDSVAMREALVWQNAPLIWLDAPLSEVVKQFNQRNRVQLSIEDADLGQRAVGGTIRADQVETFVRLLEESRDIAVERRDAEHIVLRKVR